MGTPRRKKITTKYTYANKTVFSPKKNTHDYFNDPEIPNINNHVV